MTVRRLMALVAAFVMGGAAGWGVARVTPGSRSASGLAVASGCVRIERFGGGTRASDNTPAFDAWAASLATHSENRCLGLGAGKYTFGSRANARLPAGVSVAVEGVGSGITEAIFTTNGGFQFLMDSVASSASVRRMSIEGERTGGGTAITLANGQCLGSHPSNNLDDLEIRGADGANLSHYWGMGIALLDVSTINVDRLNVYGPGSGDGTIGISYSGTAPGKAAQSHMPSDAQRACFGIALNVDHSNFYSTVTGLALGSYVQGITVSHANFTNGNGVGIHTLAPGTASNALAVSDSQFNTFGAADILIEGQFSDVSVTTSLLYVMKNKSGIAINGTGRNFRIQNNELAAVDPTGTTGVAVLASIGHGLVVGNNFTTLATGIAIARDMRFTIFGNDYNGTAIPASIAVGNTTGAPER